MNGYKTRRYAHMAYVWRCSSIAWRCEPPRKALPRDWMKALTLALHQSVHVQPGQRSGSARAPDLQGLKLVQGLVETSGEMGLVADNLLQDLLIGKQALPAHPFQILLYTLNCLLCADNV